MTEDEMRKLELIAEDIDTLCDMTLRKAKAFAEQYTLDKFGRQNKIFTDSIMDLIKIRLTMRIEKEIFRHDN